MFIMYSYGLNSATSTGEQEPNKLKCSCGTHKMQWAIRWWWDSGLNQTIPARDWPSKVAAAIRICGVRHSLRVLDSRCWPLFTIMAHDTYHTSLYHVFGSKDNFYQWEPGLPNWIFLLWRAYHRERTGQIKSFAGKVGFLLRRGILALI